MRHLLFLLLGVCVGIVIHAVATRHDAEYAWAFGYCDGVSSATVWYPEE